MDSTINILFVASLILNAMFATMFVTWFLYGNDADYKGDSNRLAHLRARFRWLTVRGDVFVHRVGKHQELTLEKKKDYGEVVRCKVLAINGIEDFNSLEFPEFVTIPKKEIENNLMKEIEDLTRYD